MLKYKEVKINWEDIKHDTTITFDYCSVEHPNTKREVDVTDIFDDGDIGGRECLCADGEYRRFKKNKASNLCLLVKEDTVGVQIVVPKDAIPLFVAVLTEIAESLKKCA